MTAASDLTHEPDAAPVAVECALRVLPIPSHA